MPHEPIVLSMIDQLDDYDVPISDGVEHPVKGWKIDAVQVRQSITL
jgi:hypothetical protein